MTNDKKIQMIKIVGVGVVKIYKSFLKFVLLTALTHIIILIFRVIKEGDIKLLNYFGILDLDAFFPKIISGWVSDLLSVLLMVVIIGIFFSLNDRERQTG